MSVRLEAAGSVRVGREPPGGGTIVCASGTLADDRPAFLVLAGEGEGRFRLVIADREGRAMLKLGPYGLDEAVARWRILGRDSGLPLRLVDCDASGLIDPGKLPPRPVKATDRRTLRVLGGRRPRFLVKRKTGWGRGRPLVYRETELATGRGV